MEELVTVGVVLPIVLGIVTVVGHGIWALLAYLFGAEARERRPQFRPVRRCPACDVPLLPGFTACSECGWPRAVSQEARNLAALRELTRQVEDFGQRSLLDPQTRAGLLAAIHQQQERSAPKLAHAPAAAPEPAAPRPAAPIEAVEAELVSEAAAEAAGPEYAFPSEAHPTPAPRRDPRERAERYIARRTTAAQVVNEPPPIAPPRPPARPWSEILAAFMEQRHIRWGELVGGLLIVCCSIALVISFWAEIAERPFLKFFVFNGVTAALFGVGVYTFRRWKLETTSHGLLLIATLLVPLNFLAIAAFSTGTAGLNVITLGGEAISVAVFSTLVYYAGRIVLPRASLLLTASVIAPSVLALAIRRHVGPESSFWLVFGLAAELAVCYCAVNLILLVSARRWEKLDEYGANALFKLLGVSTFALGLPLALLLVKTTAVAETLHELAPLAALLGLPALTAGLLFWQRITDREQAVLRTAGTSLAVFGVALMLAGIALAWPDPSGMLPAALVNFAILTGIAMLFAVPAAHLLAALCLLIFGLLAGLLIWGDITWSMMPRAMAAQLLSAHAAVVLAPVSAVLAGVAALLVRLAGRAHGLWYLVVAAAVAAVSVLLVTRHGFAVVGDTSGAVWIYAVYAAACLAAAVVGKRAELTWAGAGLLLAALVQALAFTFAPSLELDHPWLVALLVHSAAVAAGAIACGLRKRELEQPVQFPLTAFAIASSLAAAAITLWLIPQAAAGVPAVASAVLAMLWLCLALMERQVVLMALSQAALTSSVVFGVASALERQPWVGGWKSLWLDPRSLQAQAIALCVLSFTWLTMRIMLGRATLGARAPGTPAEHQASHPPEPAQSFGLLRRLEELVDSMRPSLDHVLAAVSLALLVVLAVYGAAPGAAQELSPRWVGPAAASANSPVRTVPRTERFELDGIGHEHALGVGSWLLLGSLMLLLAYSLWHRYRLWKALALLLAAAATVPLLAGLFEPQVAVASAMRWLSTAYLVLGSVVVWSRTGLVRWLQSVGALPATGETAGGSRAMRSGVIALALAPLVVMGFYVAVAALVRVPPRPEAASLLWIFGLLFIVVATVALVLRRVPSDSAANAALALARQGSALVLVLGAAPLIAMTLYVVAAALKQQPILGPEPGSFFVRIGQAASYALPILVTALAIVGYALRDRDTGFAFAGGLVMAVAATAGYLLAIAKTSAGLDLTQWVRLAQLNASVAAVYCLGWIAVVAWASGREARSAALGGGLLVTQVVLPVALHLLVLVPAAFVLVMDPLPTAVRSVIGDAWGWASAVLALAAVGVFARLRQTQFAIPAGAALLLAAGALLACSLNPWDKLNWLSFHAFSVAMAASAGAALLAAWVLRRRHPSEDTAPQSRGVTAWSTVLGILTALVGLRALGDDPQSPWWTMGACAFAAMLAAALACWSLYRIYLYPAAFLVNMTATLGWAELGTRFSGVEFVEINTLALGLAVPIWLAIELVVLRPAGAYARYGMIPVHRPAAWFAVVLVVLMVASGLVADLASSPIGTASALGWAALVAGVIGMAATLWDERMRSSVAGLYLLGLLACGMLLDSLDLEPRWIVWTGTMILAAFSLGTSYLWSRRAGLLALADRLRIPHNQDALAGLYWLVPANCLLALSVTALAFGVELNFAEFSLRFVAAKAVVAQAIAIGLLARGRRRSQLQYASLGVGALGAVALGWSVLEPATEGNLLNYAIAVLAGLAAVTALYGIGLSKIIRRENEWTAAAARLTPVLVATGTATVFLILGIEVIQFARQGWVEISPPANLIVIAALAGIFLTCLAAALIPGRDPFDLPERGRMVYVYAAEGVLALLFVHVRVTMPGLFRGFFMLYWPMIVVLVGFLGVGLSELFRRQKRIVLAEPLERTGAFLPLLPVVGFWFVDNQVHFSLLMLAVGALYAALAVTRRSFAFGVLAAVAANGGLWYFLHHTGSLGLLAHPQLWFIPPALCLLAAAYLNREQLTDAQLTSIRYFCSTVIYVSSTADIFLNGVAEAPWLPLVLAALSIAGIFAGIMLRVRGFLFLGTSFLMLSLLTIIWYAAVDLEQTWLWSVTGIVAGILIIALFAVFEKKRQEILRLADQLKQWQA